LNFRGGECRSLQVSQTKREPSTLCQFAGPNCLSVVQGYHRERWLQNLRSTWRNFLRGLNSSTSQNARASWNQLRYFAAFLPWVLARRDHARHGGGFQTCASARRTAECEGREYCSPGNSQQGTHDPQKTFSSRGKVRLWTLQSDAGCGVPQRRSWENARG